MKARNASFLDVLGRPNTQFVIPVFQRVYSWRKQDCLELLNDAMSAGSSNREHFVGTFLCAAANEGEGESEGSELQGEHEGPRFLQIIDGQQRATTLTLMLIALAKRLTSLGEEGARQAAELEEGCLLCDAGRQPKILLSSIDAETLSHLLGLCDMPADEASRLRENLELFEAEMARPGFDARALLRGCKLLRVIEIELSAADAPQEVFESLNSKGKRLAVDDLVRNAVLASTQDPLEARRLYEESWLPVETQLEASPEANMDDLLCSWMASRHQDVYLDSKSEVYPLFKKDLEKRYGGSFKRLLNDLAVYAGRFASDAQWRRQQLLETDRWLQGKPRSLISERKMFGD